MDKLRDQLAVSALAAALEISQERIPRAAPEAAAAPPPTRREAASTRSPKASGAAARLTGRCACGPDLRDLGERSGKNRIGRLMREAGLRPTPKRPFRPKTTESRHPHKIVPNWLTKVPAPERPGMVWQSDFTYIQTGEGWLYLAFTLDGSSRRCLAHHCRADLRVELGCHHLCAGRRAPAAGPRLAPPQRSRRPICRRRFRATHRRLGVTRSMSRTANPYDNALAESFVATLKTECLAGQLPPTRAAARLIIFDYIETFYNPRRRHSALGYRSPLQFEKEMFPPNKTNPNLNPN